jgi:putative phage-type endonuclease
MVKDVVPYGTPEWYKYRESGIGGSDSGVVLGQSSYTSLARLYYEKIGELEPRKVDNEATFWGRMTEPSIRDAWTMWDGDKYIGNEPMREYYLNEFYARNEKFPHLFGETDGMIPSGQPKLNGEILTKDGILECKTINGWFARKWDLGIPEIYITQIHTYMLIYEVDYAEIAILADGRQFNVIPFERNNYLCDKILNETYVFWSEKVLRGKEFKQKRDDAIKAGDVVAAAEYQEMIDSLEPEADGSDDYADMLSERFVDTDNDLVGTDDEWSLALSHKQILAYIAALEKKKSLVVNRLTSIFDKQNISRIIFDEGVVKYYKRKNGNKYQVGNYIKHKPDDSLINENLTELFRKSNIKI